MEEQFQSILDKCVNRQYISRENCEFLLSFHEESPECDSIIDTAYAFVKEQCDNIGEVGVQIGVIVGPCYVDCGFCNFAYSTTNVEDFTMGKNELTRYLKNISKEGVVTSVSLMTIHNFDFDDYLEIVETARSVLPESVRLCSNTGDLEPLEAKDLKRAGIQSAYHAVRLGESIDNRLEPIGRNHTIQNLIDAGIEVATGVEPIGPEHSTKEIVDSYYRAMDIGCHCCSASARAPVPGTRLFNSGSISERRLLQIRSALLLSSTSMNNTEFGFYGGFYGGFNRFYGEYSNSPKDVEELSEKGIGHTIRWALRSLLNNGFDNVKMADGSVEPIANLMPE